MESQLQINGQVGNQQGDGSLEIVNPHLTVSQGQFQAGSSKATQETDAYREKVRCLPKLPGKELV